MVIDLADAIALADQKIVQAESELTRFDDAFANLRSEGTAADEHAWRAAAAFEDAEKTRNEIQERLDDELRTRTELQVPSISPDFFFSYANLTIQVQQRQIRDHLEGAKSRRQVTQQKIDSEKERLAEVSNGGYARKQDECEQARNDASAARKAYEEHRNGAAALRSDAETADRAYSAAKNPVEKKKEEIFQAETLLKDLSKEGGGRQTGLPPNMSTLIRAIQQERNFQSVPVGPIANYVTLLKPKWSSILERMFGASLTGFIVNSKQDSNILLAIMRRLRVSVTHLSPLSTRAYIQ
jgi:chromosome segregation ATPase